MTAYRRVDGSKSPAGWLPVHRDQLWAQRSVTSMWELYLLTVTLTLTTNPTEFANLNANLSLLFAQKLRHSQP